MRRLRSLIDQCAWAAIVISAASLSTSAAPIVPGSGQLVAEVGDDFEDPDWQYLPNSPKSSEDIDGQKRPPIGRSQNGRWRENTDRGHPDVVRRIPTPDGGLAGSTGALLLASRNTGIPGRTSRKSEQDNVFMSISPLMGRYVPVSQGPSVVVRVYLLPFDEWEQRTGSTFALRATVRGAKGGEKEEAYWPGIFIGYKRAANRRPNEAPANLVIRAANPGNDYQKLPINEAGWWTLGMSFSPDGQIHYYAHPGVDDLTSADRLASHTPYGFRCHSLVDVFFDVFGTNDGQTWTTGWAIDDPQVYLAYPPRNQTAKQRGPARAQR